MDLAVFLRRPDVDPVPAMDVGAHEIAAGEECGEESALDRVVLGGRDEVEHARLEDVDAGVDRVGRDLARVGLLEETADPAACIRLHEPVGRRGSGPG